MLKHVSNKNAVDPGDLPSAEEACEFFRSYGVPKDKAAFIAASYSNKNALLHDFQKGMSISLYHEKQRKK